MVQPNTRPLPTPEAALGPTPVPTTQFPRLRQFGRSVLRQTVLLPIEEGRLRDRGWPDGLRALVTLGYAAFAAAALLVVVSGAVRTHAGLVLAGTALGLPQPAVWALVTLFSFCLSLLLVAALRSPWWLRLLALLVVLCVVAGWAVRTPGTAGSPLWPVLLVLLGLIVLVGVRSRRAFAWWEPAVVWALVGSGLVLGVVENRYSLAFGVDQVPLVLRYTASVLGYLVLPTAVVAGASVAEVCVRLTVSATRAAQRLSRPWLPYAVLAVVVVVRGRQLVRRQIRAERDTEGWSVLLPALVLAAAFALLAVVVRRLGRPVELDAEALGEQLGRIGLPVAAALIVVNLPVQLVGGVLPVLVTLAPDGPLATSAFDPAALVGRLVDPIRALVGVTVLVLAGRAARRGRAAYALVLGCVGVMLLALARTLFLGAGTRASIDADAINLVASVVVLVAGTITLLRRRLTQERALALALAGALTLGALFSSRDFISDPVGALLGFSGAALVLFGLTWDLLTGSAWGNGDSRRFPRPTRVLLVLAGSTTTMTVLAFAALIRDGSTTIYLDPYAEFGDVILGTALLAAALIALLAPAVPAAVSPPGGRTG